MSQEIQYSLTINTELTYSEIRKLEVVLLRVLGYVKQLTGDDPNLTKLINTIQATITATRSLQMALRAVQLASGPVGWAYAGTSMFAAALSGASIYETIRGV